MACRESAIATTSRDATGSNDASRVQNSTLRDSLSCTQHSLLLPKPVTPDHAVDLARGAGDEHDPDPSRGVDDAAIDPVEKNPSVADSRSDYQPAEEDDDEYETFRPTGIEEPISNAAEPSPRLSHDGDSLRPTPDPVNEEQQLGSTSSYSASVEEQTSIEDRDTSFATLVSATRCYCCTLFHVTVCFLSKH